MDKLKIAVLCGGLSPEREVSISSGTGVAAALAARGHRVALADLFLGLPGPLGDPEERFRSEAVAAAGQIGTLSPDLAAVRALRPDAGGAIVGPNVPELCRAADIVFLALHGADGENGKVQALLDLYGIRYTGSGCLGSAVAMDKAVSKALFRDAGIPTPEGVVLTRETASRPLPWGAGPVVVKPCCGGSSVGTSIVRDPADYPAALELAFGCEARVLVERFIQGRELTVGVVDGRAMPPVEIIPKAGFYDYSNKYQPGATEEVCPAAIGPAATAAIQELAVRVGQALHLEAYYRVDLLWDEAANAFFCLEANTLPGMTPTSLVPMMAAAEGLSYGELCEALIEASLKKYI